MKLLRGLQRLRRPCGTVALQQRPDETPRRARAQCAQEQDTTSLRNTALQIYARALESVGPSNLVTSVLRVDQTKSLLRIHDRDYKLSRNVFVIAFGHAVTGVIRSLEDSIGEHIVKSIAVLPDQTLPLLKSSRNANLIPRLPCEIYEGAEHNVPDERSQRAASRVLEVVAKLSSSHLLLTVISGGCSALLSMPKPPVTIEDDAKLNLLLREVGASIRDKNIIRKNISMLKGGGLAKAAHPAEIITLILSNLSHTNSYDLGGGPTFPDWSTPNQALDMIRKYGLSDKVPNSVIELLTKEAAHDSEDTLSRRWLRNSTTFNKDGSLNREPPPRHDCSNAHNVVIGSSQIAIDSIEKECRIHGIVPVIIDSTAPMDADRSAVMLANVALFVCEIIGKATRLIFNPSLAKAEIDCIKAGATKDQVRRIALAAEQAAVGRQPCCVILAGEQTTQVYGRGKGGPCLQLALRAAVALRDLHAEHKALQNCDVQLLSVDSDGLDGGTEAAGAIADSHQAAGVFGGKTADQFLDECNSFGFYSTAANRRHMVVTGLTGTDVMCFQLLFIGKKEY